MARRPRAASFSLREVSTLSSCRHLELDGAPSSAQIDSGVLSLRGRERFFFFLAGSSYILYSWAIGLPRLPTTVHAPGRTIGFISGIRSGTEKMDVGLLIGLSTSGCCFLPMITVSFSSMSSTSSMPFLLRASRR